ncbi:DUF885 domain-containing protein [Catenulispora subtropica]|uniref:DUF885 domain-containing protein n=1 Tax=Catenulispora subtropica TaxID=450798 RepID=A0ABP5C8U1_9ACTN
MPDLPSDALPRQVADAYLDDLIELDPTLGTYLGTPASARFLPDYSPAGAAAQAELARAALARLAEAEAQPGADADTERRCARLLRERLVAYLAVYEADEHLRAVSNINSPAHSIREAFMLMPKDTDEDYADMAARLRAVPAALDGYCASLTEGLARNLPAGPRQVGTVVQQLTEWVGDGVSESWFAQLTAEGPQDMRADLASAATEATAAYAGLRDWLRDTYAPAVKDAPDVVGRARYARWARFWNGSDTDLDEAYAYGWSEYHRLHAEMVAEAAKILPGKAPWQVLEHLDEHGHAVEGVEEVREWLQALMDEAIEALDGTHFELADGIKHVESRIAPPGSAAAAFYTPPSEDFTRPGRTWLPTRGQTRFPTYNLVTTWYHEGVPGHHLQLAQWVHVARNLSRYQATAGMVSANAEGWALYAERLMDELGFYTDPERRLGHLDAQMLRAIRVIIDIGMHLGLKIPAHSPFHPGERWTPELALDFFCRHSGLPGEHIDSELTRYLGMPGQAIGYKLGERAWLTGRAAARAAHGDAFDAKSWHMAALSLGSLGLDDLVKEISAL